MHLIFCRKQYLSELEKTFLRIRKFFVVPKTFSKIKKTWFLHVYKYISRTTVIFETEISLHEVPKSINSQTNNKSSMAYQQSYKCFSIKLSSTLLDVHDSFESFAPQVLLLAQESYLLYINSDHKNLGYIISAAIFNNYMQAT